MQQAGGGRLEINKLCAGLDARIREANESRIGKLNGGTDGRMLSQQSTEAGLLNYLLGRLEKLDADVYCGHNVAAFDMDVLLHRLQHFKVARPIELF